MALRPAASERHQRRDPVVWNLRFRDIWFRDIFCLLVMAVFAARAAVGLVVLDRFAVADRVCESESPVEELDSDEDGDSLELACQSDWLLHLVTLPPQRVAGAGSLSAVSRWCGPAPARGPPC